MKPTRSAISTVASRRSSSEAPRRWPHSWQNRAPAAVVAPQAGQVMRATLPVGSRAPGRASPAWPEPVRGPVALGHSGRAWACRTSMEEGSGGRQPHGAHAAEGTQDGAADATHACRRSPTATADVGVVLDALPAARVRRRDRRRRGVPVRARQRAATAALFDLDPESDLGGELRAVLPPDVLVPHITAFSRASREGQSVSFDVVARQRPAVAHRRDRADARGLRATSAACSASCTTSRSTSASRRCSRTGSGTTR